METKTLNVKGMMCEACAGHVARALRALGGVEAAQVSLADKRAVVTYDPAQVQPGHMTEAVAEEGYEASLAD